MIDKQLMCKFSHCAKGEFYFNREDGCYITVYNFDVISSEYNAEESFGSLVESSDCYSVYKDGKEIESKGW